MYSGTAAVPGIPVHCESPYKWFSFCRMAAGYSCTAAVPGPDCTWKLLNRLALGGLYSLTAGLGGFAASGQWSVIRGQRIAA
jgi:hypothetical protein